MCSNHWLQHVYTIDSRGCVCTCSKNPIYCKIKDLLCCRVLHNSYWAWNRPFVMTIDWWYLKTYRIGYGLQFTKVFSDKLPATLIHQSSYSQSFLLWYVHTYICTERHTWMYHTHVYNFRITFLNHRVTTQVTYLRIQKIIMYTPTISKHRK